MFDFVKKILGINHIHKVNFTYEYEVALLEDGSHTTFKFGKCSCGLWDGFPSKNFQLALENGSKKTLSELKKVGVPVC